MLYANYPGIKNAYIALVSALVISALLIMTVFSVSGGAFLSNLSVLDAEAKKQSASLAAGCVDAGLLRLANNPADTAAGTISIGSGFCTVVEVRVNVPAFGQATILAKATVRQAVTNLKVVVNMEDFSRVSREEIPSL